MHFPISSFGLEIHRVDGLAVDAAPKLLELLLLEIGVERVHLALAVILDLGQLAALKTLSISWKTCSV